MSLSLNLPPITNITNNTRADIESCLNELKDKIETTYNKKILVLLTNSSSINEGKESVLSYAVYLSFVAKNKFSYRLMELNCINADGGLPVQVNAFIGPLKPFGRANSRDELERKIEDIFKDERTRNIILSNYMA